MNQRKKHLYKMVSSALLLAIGLYLPFLLGQVEVLGQTISPLHIPALLCGLTCGWGWGAVLGAVLPLLRTLIFGRPPMPTALPMAFELAAYGCISGFLYKKLPRSRGSIYGALLIAMVVGRLVWGAARFICTGLDASAFGIAAFWSGAVTTAIPGIILHLILIPILVIALKKQKA